MRIQKFQAADMREAIAQVKRALGPDAVIVATRDIRKGLLGSAIEVTAAIDTDERSAVTPLPATASAAAPAPIAPGMSEADIERIILPIRSEMRTLRTFLKPGFANRTDELRADIEALRRELHGRMAPTPNLDEALQGTNLTQTSTGRVVALVGPTGVGKTTTIAKLAARAALVEHKRVAIVTLDTYRVGGEEQIRTFADLMGVPLHLVTDPNELGAKLADLGRMDQVYVDSPGHSPRDTSAIRILENALAGAGEIEVHLTVPAGLPVLTVESILRRYRPLAPVRLLFTKLDEADDLATIVHGPARLGLPVSFLATGQRVPEDLEDATHDRLAELARDGLDGKEVAA